MIKYPMSLVTKVKTNLLQLPASVA